MSGPSEDITTVQIRICRVIDKDGRMAVYTSLPPDLNATECLGMLDMARHEIYRVIDRWRNDQRWRDD